MRQWLDHGKMLHLTDSLPWRLIIVGIIALLLIVTAWWRYSSQLLLPESSSTQAVQRNSVPAEKSFSQTVVMPPVPAATDGQQPTPTTQLRVNGQHIPLTPNGRAEGTEQSVDGSSILHYSVSSTSTGSGDVSSSTDIQINSTSQSQVEIDNGE